MGTVPSRRPKGDCPHFFTATLRENARPSRSAARPLAPPSANPPILAQNAGTRTLLGPTA
jgi:hypothetical protein